MGKHDYTPGFEKRLRAHCSRAELALWRDAADASGARSLSEWVRTTLNRQAGRVAGEGRAPLVDRRGQVGGRRQTVVRRTWGDLRREWEDIGL